MQVRPATTYGFGFGTNPREGGVLQHILAQNARNEVAETVFGEVALQPLAVKVR